MWRCTCAETRDLRSLVNVAQRSLAGHDARRQCPRSGVNGDIMGEARSPAYVSETFYERLRAAALPDPLRLSINNSLTVLLEDDDDGIVPDDRSFAALLKFISDHPRWVAPGLTVNRQGAFIAVWEIPGVFRWSLAFL